jgi:IrrE N-terminal-like domain
VARRRATEVLAEFQLGEPPIMPEVVAEQRGITITTESRFPLDCFGALVRAGNSFRILVSANCFGEGHRRFTIAHELGHYHLDGHLEALVPGDAPALSVSNYAGSRDPFEVEADAFASEFLMPTAAMKREVAGKPLGLDLVRHVSETFKVSLSAAGVRVTMASRSPVVVLLSKNKVVEWASFSREFDGHRWSRRKWRGEWTPPKSVTGILVRDPSLVAANENRAGAGLLSEWFPGAPNIEVTEDAIGLGGYGRVLTMLVCDDLPSADEWEADAEPSGDRRDWRDALRTYRLD